MSTLSRQAEIRLFRFRIPDLDADLAIPAEWTAGVARLPFVTRLPFAPPAIQGVSRWQDTPTLIVNLAVLLQANRPSESSGDALGLHLVARAPGAGDTSQLVGWAIMPGADTLRVAALMPAADIPAGLRSGPIHAAVTIGDETVLLLNPLQLFEVMV